MALSLVPAWVCVRLPKSLRSTASVQVADRQARLWLASHLSIEEVLHRRPEWDPIYMGVATKHPEHPLDVFAPLAGHWTGTSEGVFGIATVERTCELVLGGRFFRVATRSVSEVEVHEDTGLFSFDRQAGTLMLREFHNEGYVITYRQVPSDGDVLTFESDHIENPDPTALKARISMRHAGDELRETLELASGGGDFRVCVNLRLTRR